MPIMFTIFDMDKYYYGDNYDRHTEVWEEQNQTTYQMFDFKIKGKEYYIEIKTYSDYDIDVGYGRVARVKRFYHNLIDWRIYVKIYRNIIVNRKYLNKDDPKITTYLFHALKEDIVYTFKNKQSIIDAIMECPDVINLIPDKYKKDKDIMLAAVSVNGKLLGQASPRLRSDKDVVRTACKNYGYALKYASTQQKADLITVSIAVLQNGLALQYASQGLRANRYIVDIAISHGIKTIKNY